MRQCLGCLTKECNNDTNLTFGDTGKFYLMSQTEKQEGSISDEIVLLTPATMEDGTRQMTFMMDLSLCCQRKVRMLMINWIDYVHIYRI